MRDFARAIALLEELGDDAEGPALVLLVRLYLLAGDPAKGWDLLKRCCRSKMFGPALYDLPRWSGEALSGLRIVAWGGGYGDDILFARYLLPLISGGARVGVNCRPGLVRLIQSMPGICEVRPLETAISWADYQVQTAELPALLGMDKGPTWPGEPYFHLEPIRIPGQGAKVGLVWSSDARHWEADDRTSALADMIALASIPGVTLYSLQVGASAAQASPPPTGMQIIDLGGSLRDFADTAAAILGLDLVITIDTAVANLAGALGAPAWVAVPFSADFRWGTEGETTPWYPSVRCFRQTKSGDWRSLFQTMADELRFLFARPR
jgi:hypothetical protein